MMRESAIEKTVCAIARKNGWLHFKWASANCRGVPDRIFIKAGDIVFVEFKAPGKKPSPLQHRIHRKLTKHGVQVRVIDSIEDGAALFTR